MLSSAIKHSHIDRAKTAVYQAQHQLQRFQAELGDIQLDAELNANFSELISFADFFFDSLIFDWIVQSRIDSSLKRTVDVGNQLVSLLKTLRASRKQTEAQIKALQAQREALIRQA